VARQAALLAATTPVATASRPVSRDRASQRTPRFDGTRDQLSLCRAAVAGAVAADTAADTAAVTTLARAH